MTSAANAEVHRQNGELLAAWMAHPDPTVDDYRGDFDAFLSGLAPAVNAEFAEVDAGGVHAVWASAAGVPDGAVVVHFHSGGYVFGTAHGYQAFGSHLAVAAGCPVLVVDYRLAPENPFPAALSDAIAAYRWVLDSGVPSSSIVLSGDSAGGGLCLATLLALRDAGDPLPAAAVAVSPWADLTLASPSVKENDELDPLVKGAMLANCVPMYVGESESSADPRISPVYGNWSGLPPILLMSSSTEVLRDDAKRCAEAATSAGTDATYVEGVNMVHIWPLFVDRLPEARASLNEIGEFINRHLSR